MDADDIKSINVSADRPKVAALLSIGEVAARMGKSVDDIWDLMDGDFPAPTVESTKGPEWLESLVEKYIKTHS